METGVDALEMLVEQNWDRKIAGYKDGIWLVPVPTTGFYSAVCKMDDHPERQYVIDMTSRREGEEAFAQIRYGARKIAAAQVQIVVYSREVLGTEVTSADGDFEIISINALPFEGPEIQSPVSMMRNQLGLKGGTKTVYTAQQFAESIRFWSQHAMVVGGEWHNDLGYVFEP
jgi:hypothetical protein